MEIINKKNMSYFLTNLIVENLNSGQNATVGEKDEEFQKQYKDIYDSLYSLNEYLRDLNKSVRNMNPKLYFLSDLCLLEIYSYISDAPLKALDMIKYCYRGVDEFVFADKGDSPNKSPQKNSVAISEIIGFKNIHHETIYFDKSIIISEKHITSLEFITYIMKYLDEIPNLIKKKIFSFINTNLQKNNFNWVGFCRSILNSQENFQFVYVFMEICFYHNLSISLEMDIDDINDEKIISKKQYLLADISDEETIRNHKLKFFYEKICKVLAEITVSSKFKEEFKNFKYANVIKYNQFVMETLKYKDILEDFINKEVKDTNNFFYLSLPKLTLNFEKEFLEKNSIDIPAIFDSTIKSSQNIYDKLSENTYNLESNSSFLQLALKNEYEIQMTTMNYRLNYGYKPIYFSENWVYTPQTSNYIISLASSLVGSSANIICGSNKIGKKSIIKVLLIFELY